jgi:predicted RNA-binding Zn-ribbon protein involved in translation (DUF1610 family)
MIRMPLPWLVFIALFIFLAGIILAWICYELSRRRREARKLRNWTQCPVCAFQYKSDPAARIMNCPQCGGKNEHRPIKPI